MLFGADSKAIDGTCPEALFPTEGATARVHQVSKVSPACRSLIQGKFHGFGNSENDKKTSHHNTEHNNRSGKVFSVFLKVDKGLKEKLFFFKKIKTDLILSVFLFLCGRRGSVIYVI